MKKKIKSKNEKKERVTIRSVKVLFNIHAHSEFRYYDSVKIV